MTRPPIHSYPTLKVGLLRCHRRWTGRELARRVGISSAHLSLIETGRLVPTAPIVERLAEALGFTGAPYTLLDPVDVRRVLRGEFTVEAPR